MSGNTNSDKNRKARAKKQSMSPAAFKQWRKSLKYSQKDAANALGLKRRAIQYYEKGERNGDPVEIPKAVRLACYALAQGCLDYSGPADKSSEKN